MVYLLLCALPCVRETEFGTKPKMLVCYEDLQLEVCIYELFWIPTAGNYILYVYMLHL